MDLLFAENEAEDWTARVFKSYQEAIQKTLDLQLKKNIRLKAEAARYKSILDHLNSEITTREKSVQVPEDLTS